MEKKKVWLVASIGGVLLLAVGISFALWYQVFVQEDTNVVESACFKIQFSDGEAITLNKVYPMIDQEGLKNTPYTFTLKNICNDNASYQINIETMGVEGKALPDEYIKANIEEGSISKNTTILNETIQTEVTIDGGLKAYKLLTGVLNPNEEKEFSLRLWMHEGVEASEDSMNASFNGRVSVITSYMAPLSTIADTIKSIPVVTEGSGLYEVDHSDAEITYTEDVEAQNMLKLTEYRYAGENPDNYVKFNNELWRIIGLVNTPEGQRVKIIRDESIGDYSWDTSETSVNGGYGVNEWSESDIMHLLNDGPYYNRTSGTCYNGHNNTITECDFSETGLTEEAKRMIDTITWNTVSNDGVIYTPYNMNTQNFYDLERSNNIERICSGTHCNDTVTRTSTWKGMIGLMYPSDYGYATSGGITMDRSTCLDNHLSSWGDETTPTECGQNDWLFGDDQWSIFSSTDARDNASVMYLYRTGAIVPNNASYSKGIVPVLYLKTTVKMVNGQGTMDAPYELNY